MISRATSGKPSFLTNGNTAAFVGANTDGSFKTVRVDPSSSVSSCKALEKTARNKRSKPTDVSTTYGTYDALVSLSKNCNFLPECCSCAFKSKSVLEWIPSNSLKPNGKLNSISVAALA